jgi:aminopeptidase N
VDMKDKTTPEKFMDTWLQQMNFPEVDVALNRNPSQDSTTFTFTQDRFLLSIHEQDQTPSYISPFK